MGCSCCGQQALRDIIPGKAREIAKALLTHLRRQGGTLNKSLDSRRDIGGIGLGHKTILLVPQESGRFSGIRARNHRLVAHHGFQGHVPEVLVLRHKKHTESMCIQLNHFLVAHVT